MIHEQLLRALRALMCEQEAIDRLRRDADATWARGKEGRDDRLKSQASEMHGRASDRQRAMNEVIDRAIGLWP